MQKPSVLHYLKLNVQCFEEACLARLHHSTNFLGQRFHEIYHTQYSTLLYMFSMPVPISCPLLRVIFPCTPLPSFSSPCIRTVPVLCTYDPLYTYCTCNVYVCPPVHVLYLYCVRMTPCTCTVPVLCTYDPLYTYCTRTVYVCPPVHVLYPYCVCMSPCTRTVPVLCMYVPLYMYCTRTVYVCPPVHVLYPYCVCMSPCTCTVPVLCMYVPLYTYCTRTVYVCPPVHVLYPYCVCMSPCTRTVPVLCTYVPLYTYCTRTVYVCPPVHVLYPYCVRMSPCTHMYTVRVRTHVLSSNPKLVCLCQADVRIREGIDFPATIRKCVRCEVDTFVGLILDPPSEQGIATPSQTHTYAHTHSVFVHFLVVTVCLCVRVFQVLGWGWVCKPCISWNTLSQPLEALPATVLMEMRLTSQRQSLREPL